MVLNCLLGLCFIVWVLVFRVNRCLQMSGEFCLQSGGIHEVSVIVFTHASPSVLYYCLVVSPHIT